MPAAASINCPLHNVPELVPCDLGEVQPLVDHLRANQPVTEPVRFPRGTLLPDGRLDLCKQNLGPAGCRLITQALVGNPTVTSLLMGTDGIGDEGAGELAKHIPTNPHLEIVYLGCNRITEKGATELAQVLADNTTVTGLWLKRNPIGPGGARAVASMLRRNRTLRTLDLVNTNPGPEGISAILSALIEENRTLERLFLGGNQLGMEEARRLGDLLRAAPNLQGLFLNVNHLQDGGIEMLAAGLKANRTLRQLGLASNGITAKGGAILFEAIQDHPALVHVDLGFSPSTRVLGASANCLGDEGAIHVGKYLAHNQTMLRLDLQNNHITEAGKISLLAGLEKNSTLQHLMLDGKLDPRINAILQANRLRHPCAEPRKSRDVALIRSVYRSR
jgi:Ran GTPase-activating protein (RanGAP) involved in mRNA processing and transport